MTTQIGTPRQQPPTRLLSYRTPATAPGPEEFTPAHVRRRIGVGVDTGKLWAGGAASAVVAALVALTGVLACRWLFGLSVLAPHQAGAYGDVHTTALILIAAAAALAATGLVHLLMVSTLRPRLFFGWIGQHGQGGQDLHRREGAGTGQRHGGQGG